MRSREQPPSRRVSRQLGETDVLYGLAVEPTRLENIEGARVQMAASRWSDVVVNCLAVQRMNELRPVATGVAEESGLEECSHGLVGVVDVELRDPSSHFKTDAGSEDTGGACQTRGRSGQTSEASEDDNAFNAEGTHPRRTVSELPTRDHGGYLFE
jgi:hypothetical protein